MISWYNRRPPEGLGTGFGSPRGSTSAGMGRCLVGDETVGILGLVDWWTWL